MKITLKEFKRALLAVSAGIMATLYSTFASAAIVSDLTVVRVGCNAEQVACIVVLDQAIGPAACTNALVSWDGTTSAGKNAYAALLTAKAAGLKVRVNFNDGACNGSSPQLKTAILE